MTALLSAEWLKMRKRWMPRILILILLGIIALVFWGVATNGQNRPDLYFPRGLVTALLFAVGFAAFLWPVLGGSWGGNEYGWGTIRMILSRRPSRIEFNFAALVILVLTVALGLVAVLILGALAGILIAGLTGNDVVVSAGLGSSFPSALIKTFLATWYVSVFFLVLAYASGVIFRSAAAGIGIGIGINVAQLVVTGIFDSLGGTWRSTANHFPYAYANVLVPRVAREVISSRFVDRNPTGPGAQEAVFGLAIYLVILLVALLLVVRSRDVTA